MVMRTRSCDPGVRLERLRKAEEFSRVGGDALDLAEDESDVSSAAATMFIHAGIAAGDVICCARLGELAQGEDHRQAIELLRQADAASAPHLAVLLSLKTKAAYSHVRLSPAELVRARRAAEHLLATARRIGSRSAGP